MHTPNLDVDAIHLLKEEVIIVFGHSLKSSGDCNKLQEDIYKKSGDIINFNTLRRFFGLIKTEFNPSKNTLNILSRYCGYESFQNFTSSFQIQPNKENNELLIAYLVDIFRSVAVNNEYDETFHLIVQKSVSYLLKFPGIKNEFYRKIVRTENGRNYYFEQYFHIDELATYYGQGIMYYLAAGKNNRHQVFGYSVLCMRAWLMNNDSELEACYQKLESFKTDTDLSNDIASRVFSARLFYANIKNQPTGTIIKSAKEYYSKIESNYTNNSPPVFEQIFSFSLILTGHFPEALYYLNRGFLQYSKYKVNSWYKFIYNEDWFYIGMGIIHAYYGEIEVGKAYYHKINISKSSVLSKRTGAAFLQILKSLLSVHDKNGVKYFNRLIKDTSFYRLKNLYKEILDNQQSAKFELSVKNKQKLKNEQ